MIRGQQSQWSKCGNCGTWDWNKNLSSRKCSCAKCGHTVQLFEVVEVTEALRAQFTPSTAPSKASTAEDTLKRVSGQWRDANAKHDQAVAAVIRCQANLDRAQQREKEAAMILAQADVERKQATAVFAKEVGGGAGEGQRGQADTSADFDIVWDDTRFQDLDQLDGIEAAEKEDLLKVRQELQHYKTQLAAKGGDVKTRIARAKALRDTIHTRSGKKRKTETADGGLVEGGNGAQPSEAPATAAPDGGEAAAPTAEAEVATTASSEVEEAAANISASKIAAAKAAAHLGQEALRVVSGSGASGNGGKKGKGA
ncbi:unnamed protein product, partial [Prorocentrum cordatum]